jgi:hypothetical protein
VGANQLRKKYLPKLYDQEVEKLNISLKNEKICVIVDETTDACGRAAVNVLFTFKDQTKLVATEHVIVANNTTISQIILSTLQKYQVSFNNVLFFITDNAAYMVKTFRNLSPIMPQMKHNTCLAHIMNLVGECWVDYSFFRLLDNITSNIKSSFVHSSARKRRWISYLSTNAINNPTLPPFFEIPEDNFNPNITLPPLPVKTRWCSWFRFVFWLSDYIPYIIAFFIEEEKLDDGSKAIRDLGRTFRDQNSVFNFEIMVLFIKCNANR